MEFRTFLLKVLLFSVIILMLLTGVELILMTKDNEFSYKKQYLIENGESITCLILGHSHTQMGLIADSLPDTLDIKFS